MKESSTIVLDTSAGDGFDLELPPATGGTSVGTERREHLGKEAERQEASRGEGIFEGQRAGRERETGRESRGGI